MLKLTSAFLAAALCMAQPDPAARRSPVSPQPQSGQPQAGQPEQKRASMEGKATSANGQPLRKVALILNKVEGNRDGEPYTASTDAEGKWVLADVEPGRYHLFANRTGYVSTAFGARPGSRVGSVINLAPGQQMSGLQLTLTPQAVITGKVTDEDGEPMQHASVQVLTKRYMRGKRQLMGAGGAQVNDLGEYRLSGLNPGKYYVSVSQMRMGPFGMAGSRNNDGYTQTYYPGVADPNQATLVEVRAGAEVPGIDFRLTPVRTYRVKGKVIDGSTNRPVREGMVMVMNTEAGGFSGARSGSPLRNAEGSFELRGVVPGNYLLAVNTGGRFAVQQKIDVGNQDVEGVTVVVAPPGKLSGVLRVEGQEKPQTGPLRIQLENLENAPMFGGAGAVVKDDRTFLVENVNPGRYRISLFGLPENTYLKSVKTGGEEVLDSGLNVPTGGATLALELTLSTAGAQVAGSVLNADQKAMTGATVAVLAEDASKRENFTMNKMAKTDQNGSFTLKGLPPGDYLALAWEDIEEGAWMDPDLLKEHSAKAIKVKLKESGSESLQLKVIPVQAGSAPQAD